MKHGASRNTTPAGMEQSRLFASLVRAEKLAESSPVIYVVSVREASPSGEEIYRHWITRHRYSDFHKLHVELRRLGFPCPRMPPRTWPLTLKSEVFIDQRKEALDLWLQSCLCILQSIKREQVNHLDVEKAKTLFANFLIEHLKEKISAHMERRIRRLQQLKIGKAINITPLGDNESNQEFVTYSVVGNEVAHNFSPHTATVSFNGEEGETTPCSVCSIPPTPTSQGEFFKSWSMHTTNSLRLCADILKKEMSEPAVQYKSSNAIKNKKQKREKVPFDLQDQSSFPASDHNAIGTDDRAIHLQSLSESQLRPEEYIDSHRTKKVSYDYENSNKTSTITRTGPTDKVNPKDTGRIPKIIGCSRVDGKVKFKVRWADTWETLDSLLQFMSIKRLRNQAQDLNGLARSVCNDLEI
uniref:PX domain-containing protein n=1 Tax=Aplanochytrium stocchinoi TaxID=215587 RepID=A0A7S3PHC1_9STRA|mmetsp:Transcript_17368/g.21369  ORF Transcript_17368/g.21369 Transcript_17368/m.21369 type:complete len:412 (+) Transcript_17368:194-1429(+)|eukprot:CAMPEP_0204823168 /NCGR_PEP_ID=MMETSP1346-20131115/1277_1 /ASSEMBLY_ACC=CAM_ASM_000771 /TAXON_ID=215587 /ORGANISM="Aplanochytrium stocchinoi, Strain GSBS06" /LENGTH=411 /DNA_ID=CAMNT_0051949715 /DNA_START=241 /DNA_END=1476 /DNA_ORIENTATION=+